MHIYEMDLSHQLELRITHDGSSTLYRKDLDEPYHSIHGAIEESLHVFIRMGLEAISHRNTAIKILEIGFGTGLNAWLTRLYQGDKDIHYTALEKHPLPGEIWRSLNYATLLPGKEEQFESFHTAPWDTDVQLTSSFLLRKIHQSVQSYDTGEEFDLIYFDAFAPEKQPSMWTMGVFKKLWGILIPGGIMVTYCAKGAVRRTMQASGFEVERLPGPPYKREMLRARKSMK